MDPNTTPDFLAVTMTDVVTGLIEVGVYIAIGVAALAQAPRDARTRVFLALGCVYSIATLTQITCWALGIRGLEAVQRIPAGIVLSAFSVVTLLLFHFSQVFPTRRGWIRQSGIQLPIAYALTPVIVFILVRGWPARGGQVTGGFALLVLVFGFPLAVLLALVLPIATLVSFSRSLRELGSRPRTPDARPPVAAILTSQLAGLTLGILVLGPLGAVAPESWTLTFAAVTVWLIGLVTPVAFAAAVWKYRVLEIPVDPSAEVQPD